MNSRRLVKLHSIPHEAGTAQSRILVSHGTILQLSRGGNAIQPARAVLGQARSGWHECAGRAPSNCGNRGALGLLQLFAGAQLPSTNQSLRPVLPLITRSPLGAALKPSLA